MPSAIKFSEADIIKIIDLYISSKLAPSKIGKVIGCSAGAIKTVLKKQGIDIRNLAEAKTQYPVLDPHFFDIIDTEHKAYYLGFLFADGCVRSDPRDNAVVVKLAVEDKDFLARFSHDMLGIEKVYHYRYDYEKSVTLKFSNPTIKQALISHGCTPVKSLTVKFPTTIPKHLIHHFVRGYFDGDGSIYKGAPLDWNANFCATLDFCSGLIEICEDLGINYTLNKDTEGVKRGNDITTILLVRGNRQIVRLMDWLYKDAIIYLPRKYECYRQLKSWIAKVDSHTSRYSKVAPAAV